MDVNYHYYVTYTAAVTAGYTPAEAAQIATASRYVDEANGVTVQNMEDILYNNIVSVLGSEDDKILEIAHIWPIFHFLPGDPSQISDDLSPGLLSSTDPMLELGKWLICKPESTIVQEVVHAARQSVASNPLSQQSLIRAGITMHVLADTFAHQNFVGLPLKEINEVTGGYSDENDTVFEEIKWVLATEKLRNRFKCLAGHEIYSPAGPSSKSFGYLGHGRMGLLPDKTSAIYGYAPAWYKPGDFLYKDNRIEFYNAWLQMVEALTYLRQGGQFNQHVAGKVQYFDANNKPYILAFAMADTDEALPDLWLPLFPGQTPPPYQKPTGTTYLELFETEATAHRDTVVEKCPRLKYLLAELKNPT